MNMMHMKLTQILAMLALGATTLLNSCSCQEVLPPPLSPLLEVQNPFDLGESHQGISVRKTLALKNVGDGKMEITDFRLTPDDGVFVVGIADLPAPRDALD